MKQPENTFRIEQLIEAVLNVDRPYTSVPADMQKLAEEVLAFDCTGMRVVVCGGGTGLSTVIGGNSQLADWPDNPYVGLKQEFPCLEVVVCTTDDGRSTGEFLKQLPMIGIGDLRKLCISMILARNLENTYGVHGAHCDALIRCIHRIFNHRFPEGANSFSPVADPLLLAPEELRRICPTPLKDLLRSLGTFLTPEGRGPTVKPGGHSLGNMLLTAAIFMENDGHVDRPPGMAALRAGLDRIARAIGVTPGRLHPATDVPGQLVFRYGNGVEVHGQSKSSTARRGFPVERVYVEYFKTPTVGSSLIKALHNADLIILAPGSLYTSIIPILQLYPIADAIRANRRALKILGVNFWIQEGETDISKRGKHRGFHVSELIEAYDHNVPGGFKGLFYLVLSANLEHVPGNILRNYALEGKKPIYLDRQLVETMGVRPVESTVFSLEHLSSSSVIHHDPKKFALAIRTLLYARNHLLKPQKAGRGRKKVTMARRRPYQRQRCLLCHYLNSVNRILDAKDFRPAYLREAMSNLVWENRDIQIEHLRFFRGIRVVPDAAWNRSSEWGNILGYYDPEDRFIKIHTRLLDNPEKFSENVLIALGESLLGRYIESSCWIEPDHRLNRWGTRCYEIMLRPPRTRECFLSPAELRTYLVLSRMVPHPKDSRRYRITLNNHEGFLPPGLLFGLLYAWYLDNTYGPIMEYEMSLLHWHSTELIPHQMEEHARKSNLIGFFRKMVFGYEG